jgi:hypothetical protein
LAVVTRVLLAEPGAWICLEEPETHLHPRAQAQLLAFLDRESAGKRIFIATHSTPLAAQVPIESLFLVNRDAEECTRVSMVTIQSAGDVISQLGVQPSLDMDAAAVVFVEDVDLIPVYEAWAAKFPFQTKVQFMPLGGAETLLYHANLRVVSGRQVHTRVYVVGGQAVERDSRWHGLKTKLVKQLELPADHVVTLDVNWVEDYLLDATTIASAFPKATLRGDEFESRLATCQSCDERKLAVTELYSEIGLRLAYAEASARLAGAMKQIPKAVRVLFERIDVQSRPFWSV